METSTAIVCICGTTLKKDFLAIAKREKALGKIVLMPESLEKNQELSEDQSKRFNLLQINKIRASDEVIVINPGEFSCLTRNQIAIAVFLNKLIKFEYEPSQEILNFIKSDNPVQKEGF